MRPELYAIRASQDFVTFPMFNFADADEVHLVGIVRARLNDFVLSGPPEDWFMDLTVDPGLIAGTCCGQPGLLAGNKVVAICGVDSGAFAACEGAVE